MFLTTGLLVTECHYWRNVSLANQDTVFPLIAYLVAFVWVATLPRVSRQRPALLVTSSILFGLFAPTYVPFLLAALWCCRGDLQPTLLATLVRNRSLTHASLASAAAGAVAFGTPAAALIIASGYRNVASSVASRSGLDGDTTYFLDAAQALLRPYWGEPRTLSTLLVPAFVPLLACLLLTLGSPTAARRGWLASFAFLFAPYLFTLVLFPQAVSIHPYLYDQLLFLPAALLTAVWATTAHVQRRLQGALLLLAGLLLSGLVMWNLISIAQTMRGLAQAATETRATPGTESDAKQDQAR